MIVVFNKIDAFSYTPKDDDDLTPRTKENIPLCELEASWKRRLQNEECIFISAKKQINIDKLKEILYQKAKEVHTMRFPYNDFLFQKYDQELDQ
jgi:GTP-binding protein HflX